MIPAQDLLTLLKKSQEHGYSLSLYQSGQVVELIEGLQKENENLTIEVEHFARLTCDDLGKNPPKLWRVYYEEAQAQIAALTPDAQAWRDRETAFQSERKVLDERMEK